MKIETPKFSIIVPVYNVEKYLHKCIESLLRQGIDNVEILLVNDGSTDSSSEICQEYVDKYSNIKLLYQDNQGVCAARNNGIVHATGEWIVLVDADDYLLDNGLKAAFEAVCSPDSFDVIQYGSSYDFWPKRKLSSELVFKGSGHEYILKYGFVSFYWLCFYRREFLRTNDIRFHDHYIVGEDQLFVANVFLHNPRIAAVSTDLYRYVVHDDSATTKRDISHTRRCVDDYLLSYHDICMLAEDLTVDNKVRTSVYKALNGKKMFGYSRMLSAQYDYHMFCEVSKRARQYRFYPIMPVGHGLKGKVMSILMNLTIKYFVFYKLACWIFNGIISKSVLPRLRMNLKDGK